ncbi:hypothetical protein H1W00_04115 [Aeromicrobium sp. Marseille-Q0843]|uniref:Uncharacterized protein n=1 Tax=Aeromicrobium phoceense TaxID=2754045 RepID=A0A838XL54_9ACTN|nr:hypothetical protein [Aeromicrobium phoceense]MBA4607654.1 hypothetical protein [Aeromicrobium phoceense]
MDTAIASGAPLAVVSMRKTLRGSLADDVAQILDHEISEHAWCRQTEAAPASRRTSNAARPCSWPADRPPLIDEEQK